jgi:DNA polymerase III alpha subunit
MLDKKDAEVLNLLKIDALGLTQLSIFERTLELLGHGIKTSNGIIVPTGFFEKLPLDDQKAFDVLNEGKFSGIFQFAGRALQGLTKEVTVDNLEDIVSITALARPGPMGSGGAGDWVKRRSGREEVTYIHPLMEELTKDTYGVLIYQEQVMHIVRKIGGLSWGDTSDIRRAIGKSMGAEALEKYYEMFKEGAIKNGVEEYIARKIWNDIVTFGRYGFNRSHAYAYACVSYYCCWLKAYHPIEFCAATLDAEPDVLKQRQLLIEMEKEDVGYIPMDPKLSTANWEVTERDGKDMLLGPLTTIRGLGPKVVQEVLAARNSNLPVRETIQKKLEKAKTEIDTLYPVRDSARKHYRKIKMTDLDTLFIKENHKNIEDIKAGHAGIVCCIGILTRAAIKDENAPEVVERRRGKEVYTEKTNSLAMFFQDDTGDIFCKIDRFGFEGMGKDILENGKIGKSIYVVFGTVPRSFRMISVSSMKYLGELED